MRKTILALLLVLIFVLAGCSQQAETTEAPEAEEPAAEEPAAEEAEAEEPAAEEPEAEESDQEPIELVYLTFETPVLDAAFWDNSIADALTNLPDYVTINRIISPDLDRTTYAKQLLASGQFPDLLQSINTQEFVDAELLASWDPAWLEENMMFPDGTALNGEVWMAPTNAQIIPLIFYNKEMFADVGVEAPTTWAEFEAVLSALDEGGYKPLQMVGAGDAWATTMLISGLISAETLGENPTWVQDRNAGTTTFEEGTASAWEKFAWMVDMGYIDEADMGMGYVDASQAFYNGEVAMFPMGSWLLQPAAKESSFDVGVFVLPRDDGKIVVPYSVGGGIHISADAPPEAMEFAKSLALSPVFMRTLIENDSAFPLYKNLSIEDFGAEGISDLYYEGYGYVGLLDAILVDAFGWVSNDNAPVAGGVDEFTISAQNVVSGIEYLTELQRLDAAWDSLIE